MAKGQIKAVRRESNDILVDVEIVANGIGHIPITVKVSGPITHAPEQARKIIYALGGELAQNFDSPNSLS